MIERNPGNYICSNCRSFQPHSLIETKMRLGEITRGNDYTIISTFVLARLLLYGST
jgi:hypothetical protein